MIEAEVKARVRVPGEVRERLDGRARGRAEVYQDTWSKPEHETVVEDAEAVHAMLRGLGYVPAVAFEKRCRNYAFEARGRHMLATLVRVPEVDGTFLELETLVEEKDLAAALDDVRWPASSTRPAR
ncbi:hypothetical protein ACWDYJ_33480 [Streptomyces sp. NPDC003042]